MISKIEEPSNGLMNHWRKLVREKVAAGMNFAKATREVERKKPGLRAEAVAAANGKEVESPAERLSVCESLATTEAKKFERLVAVQVSKGMTRTNAISFVVENHPNIHKAFVDRANGRTPKKETTASTSAPIKVVKSVSGSSMFSDPLPNEFVATSTNNDGEPINEGGYTEYEWDKRNSFRYS